MRGSSQHERRGVAVAWGAAALVLVLLAFWRPIDHDESQYVAAARLAWRGLVYRDFAYLQTPFQPLLFAPLAAVAGEWAFIALRLANALLGLATLAMVFAAARAAGAGRHAAGLATALFAACDVYLFSANVARNDMVPAALLAFALWRMIAGRGRRDAALIGLALAAATAAKLSYALPAIAYGAAVLIDRRRHPLSVILGAVPPAALVAWTWWHAPDAFVFEVLRFPVDAPAQAYAGSFKLTLAGRAIDLLKFLALGPALVALVLVARDRGRPGVVMLEVMIVAGLVAAIIPAPTWRQYLLPALPPLFVRLALLVEARPIERGERLALMLFAAVGLAPSLAAFGGPPGALAAWRETRAVDAALTAARVEGPVATLAPQLLGAHPIDRRFAAGPFFFRSNDLLPRGQARAMHLLAADDLAWLDQAPPAAILTGAEAWTSGDPALDNRLDDFAAARGWRPAPIASRRLRLWIRPR